ncbi:MAG: nitroreductase family protein [Spirochaetaceae bacterium]|nr:nitroreductase family protein [Spirochaetaceae bacterium]
MKKHINLIFAAAAFTAVFASCSKSEASGTNLSFVEDIPTIQAFTQEAVPLSDLEKIVKAGINTQSAMNGQPWHFSVVTNKELLDKISKDMASGMKRMSAPDGDKLPPPPPASAGAKAGMGDSPAAIIISAKDGSEFDAGLATQLMTIEAVSLGYGTKIISSPTIALNGENQAEYKKALEIPETMNAKAVILIGKYDKSKADAVTGATPRKAKDEVVSFIK